MYHFDQYVLLKLLVLQVRHSKRSTSSFYSVLSQAETEGVLLQQAHYGVL